MSLILLIDILIGHVFHSVVSLCTFSHRAILYAHQRSKTTHGTHWANNWLVIEDLLIIILVILHHLVPILPPSISRSNTTNVLAHCHVEILFLLITLISGLRWSLSLVSDLAILGEIGNWLSYLWRIGRVQTAFVVLETLLLLDVH